MSHTNFRNEELSKAVSALMSSGTELPDAPIYGRHRGETAHAYYIDQIRTLVVEDRTDLPMRFGYKTEDRLAFIDFDSGPFISEGTALRDIIHKGDKGLAAKVKTRFGSNVLDKIYTHDNAKRNVGGEEKEFATFIMTVKPASE